MNMPRACANSTWEMEGLTTKMTSLYNGFQILNRWEHMKRIKLILLAIFIVLVSGCGNYPTAGLTPDGFDPPYDYY